MWVCLNADRSLGAIRIEPGEIARVLGKTEAEIRANLRDLFQAEIGQPTPDGAIQIADRFWPYERAPTGQQAEKLAPYISQLSAPSWAGAVYEALSPLLTRKSLSNFTMPGCPLLTSNTRFCSGRYGSTWR
jgi:hypothetical protein